MGSYGYLNIIQKYIAQVRNSPERVRKTVFTVSVVAVTSAVFLGWLLTIKIFSSPVNQTKELGSDASSIFSAFQERLDRDKGKYSTPPVYFLDTGEIPTTK